MNYTPEEKKTIEDATAKLLGEPMRYIKEVAESIDRTYEEFMAELDAAVEAGGDSINTGDNDVSFPDEVWKHYQIIKGVEVGPTVRDNTWFSCAC
jgi:hypothetical protein